MDMQSKTLQGWHTIPIWVFFDTELKFIVNRKVTASNHKNQIIQQFYKFIFNILIY